MTVRAGIHVLHVSRVYGRTIGHRATNCNLPFSQHHSTPTLPPRQPRPSRRSHVVPLLGQDNHSDVGMATPGASSQCSFQQKIQVFHETEEENGQQSNSRQNNQAHDHEKAPLLPHAGILCRLQGWLLRRGQTPPFPSSPPAGSTVLGTPRCFSWQSSGLIRLGLILHRDRQPCIAMHGQRPPPV